MAVDLGNHLPAVSEKARRCIVSEPAFNFSVDGDAIIIIKDDEFTQTQRTGQGTGLVGNALHQAAIADKGVGIVINNGVLWLIELGRQHFFCQRHTHRIAQALPQGAGSGLYTRGIAMLRMAGGLTVHLAEIFQLFHRQIVAAQM